MKRIFDEAICQLCLQVDVKLNRISDTHHVFIERILHLNNIHYIPTENLSICGICRALLSKSYNFVQTVRRAQQIVCDLLQNTDLITKSTLNDLDRHTVGLNPIELSSTAITTLDDSTSLEIEVQSLQHCGDFSDVEEKVEITYKEEDVSGPTEYNDVALDHEDNSCDTKDPLLSVVQSNAVPLNIDTVQCDNTPTKPVKQTRKKAQWTRTKKGKYVKPKPRPGARSKRQLSEHPDYAPARDSTSHSEDSACDEYDDQGKTIKKPKPVLVYPRKCDHCSYVVAQSNLHYRHYQFVHPGVSYPYAQQRNYACAVCGKLMTRATITSHERSHASQPVQCGACHKWFANSWRLSRHAARVHPARVLRCHHCSKEFKTKTDIVRHLRIHSGSKPYACPLCDAAFAHSGNRTIHLRKVHHNST